MSWCLSCFYRTLPLFLMCKPVGSTFWVEKSFDGTRLDIINNAPLLHVVSILTRTSSAGACSTSKYAIFEWHNSKSASTVERNTSEIHRHSKPFTLDRTTTDIEICIVVFLVPTCIPTIRLGFATILRSRAQGICWIREIHTYINSGRSASRLREPSTSTANPTHSLNSISYSRIA